MPAKGVEIQYKNVSADAATLEEMKKHSGGKDAVPVIVYDDGKVEVGYGGT